jgi:hypothetical protein
MESGKAWTYEDVYSSQASSITQLVSHSMFQSDIKHTSLLCHDFAR